MLIDEEDNYIASRQGFRLGYMDQTWLQPRLQNRKLTEAVRKIETTGLGSREETLLCIIPMVSFKNALPNRQALNFLPEVVEDHGWIERAECFITLLGRIDVRPDAANLAKDITFAAVVSAVDFLFFSHDRFQAWGELPPDPSIALGRIVAMLLHGYVIILKKLQPLYSYQKRRQALRDSFEHYTPKPLTSDQLQLFNEDSFELNRSLCTEILSLTPVHLAICDFISNQNVSFFYLSFLCPHCNT